MAGAESRSDANTAQETKLSDGSRATYRRAWVPARRDANRRRIEAIRPFCTFVEWTTPARTQADTWSHMGA